MTISSTRSIGLPENEVGSAVETEVIKPSPGGSTAHPPLDHDGPEILRLGGSTHLAQSKLPMCNNRRKSIFGALSSATAKVKRDRELWRRPPDFPASRAPRELRVAIPVRLSALPDLLLGAGVGRHRLDRFELVAAHQVHAGEDPFQLFAQPRLDLALDPRKRPHRTRGNAGEIVEKP